ncbi:VWA domain-containing protein [Hymenobacter gummosus]|uniref:VWA domain-containing protein n=1 Tax=Hymenobacter gummosus TaxID=1776032 RepID=A0A431U6L7_9BACT|nr:VWA domain-containing protein [Hymenobacter gummosus]RTQ52286.1 VWA domain-containing protein [Hymenobacter gummosus]
MLTWLYSWAQGETLLAAAALLLYAGYLLRTARLARPLGQRAWRTGWKLLPRLLAFGLLLLALLGPAYGLTQRAVRTAGKDLWLLVDLSRSMDADDVAPSRLQKARAELAELVQRFPADRIGLIVFGSDAYVHCPLTYDQEALLLLLNTLDTRLVPPGSTDLAQPLTLALTRQAATAGPSAGAPPRATALVLVSDGEDFGESMEAVLRDLTRSGLRLYTVGVGTAAGGRMPRPGGYVRDAQGKPAVTRLQAAPLRRLAEATGGIYVELTDRHDEFPLLLRALGRLEGQAQQVRTVTVADNRYAYPLAAALLLLALDVVLTVTVIKP